MNFPDRWTETFLPNGVEEFTDVETCWEIKIRTRVEKQPIRLCLIIYPLTECDKLAIFFLQQLIAIFETVNFQ